MRAAGWRDLPPPLTGRIGVGRLLEQLAPLCLRLMGEAAARAARPERSNVLKSMMTDV